MAEPESRLVVRMEATLARFERQMRQGVAIARTSARQMEQPLAGVGRGFDLRGVTMQLSQVAQQASATGRPLQALAVQLPDLALAFGPVGIAIGAAAGALLPLAANMLSTGDQAETLQDQLDELRKSVDAYVKATRDAAQTPQQLAEDYGINIAQARELLEVRRQLQRLAAAEDLRGTRAEIASDFGDFTAYAGEEARRALEERLALIERIADAEARFAAADAAGRREEATAAMNEVADLTARLQGYDGLAEKVGALADGLEIGTDAAGRLAVALATVDDSADPQGQARAWAAAREALLDAVGSYEQLNEEGQKLLDAITDGEDAALRMAAADLRSPFAAANEEASKFRGYLQDALGFIQGIGGGLGAVGDWLGSFAPSAAARGLAGATDGVAASAALIREREGFRSTPYWDVNAWRVGYGSDTITLSDGTIQRVTQGMAVSVEDANRDLIRRIEELQAVIATTVGPQAWERLTPPQQAAITSLAYNYGAGELQAGGDLARVMEGLRLGNDEMVGLAIRARAGDNGGINRQRRLDEASIFLGGIGDEEAARRQEEEARRASEQAARDAAEQSRQSAAEAEAEARAVEAARAAYDSLVGSMDRTEAARQAFAQGVAVLDEALARGTITTEEYAAAMEMLRRRLGGEEVQIALDHILEGAEELEGRIDAVAEAAERGANRLTDLFMSVLDRSMSAKEAVGQLLMELARVQMQQALLGFAAGGGQGVFATFGSLLTPQVAAPSLEGGGFTGHGPRIGGLDGRGGFPAILHPGETVIDHTRGQGAGGGAMDVRVYVDQDGNWRAAVDRIAARRAQSVIPAAKAATMRQLQRTKAGWA